MRKCFLFTILISLTFSDTERFNCFNELHNANEFSIINNVLDKHIHRDLPCQYTCLLSKNFSDSKQKNKTLSFHVKKRILRCNTGDMISILLFYATETARLVIFLLVYSLSFAALIKRKTN